MPRRSKSRSKAKRVKKIRPKPSPPRRKRSKSSAPKRRRGGQQLPASVQDRPEQNAGYDEAVHGRTARQLENPPSDFDVDLVDDKGSPEALHVVPDVLSGELTSDDRAERDTIREVRRRERRGRGR